MTGARAGAPLRVAAKPQAIAAGEGAIWVATKDGSVHRIVP
jgi:hypothetical protein